MIANDQISCIFAPGGEKVFYAWRKINLERTTKDITLLFLVFNWSLLFQYKQLSRFSSCVTLTWWMFPCFEHLELDFQKLRRVLYMFTIIESYQVNFELFYDKTRWICWVCPEQTFLYQRKILMLSLFQCHCNEK